MYVASDIGRDTYYENETKTYRIGTVYIGYQNYQFGWTSEFIRHTIQNKWTHDGILHGDSKWFEVLDKQYPASLYGNNSPYYRYSLW